MESISAMQQQIYLRSSVFASNFSEKIRKLLPISLIFSEKWSGLIAKQKSAIPNIFIVKVTLEIALLEKTSCEV